MNEDLHNNIDDLFKKGLEGKEDRPSKSVWAAIEKGLDSMPLPAPSAPGSGGWLHPVLFKGLGGIALIALLSTGIHLWKKSGTETKKTHAPSATPASIGHKDARTKNSEAGPFTPGTKSEVEYDQMMPDADSIPGSRMPTAQVKNPAVKKEFPVINERQVGHALRAESMATATRNNTATESKSAAANMEAEGQDRTAVPRDRSIDLAPTKPEIEAAAGNSPIPEWETFPEGKAVARDRKTSPEDIRDDLTRSTEEPLRRTDGRVVSDRKRNGFKMTSAAEMPASWNRLEDMKRQPSAGSALRQNKLTSRFSITPVMVLNMTKLKVQENRSFGGRNGRERDEYRETERTRTTSSPGILASFSITPVLSIQAGVSEFRNDISIRPKDIKAVRDRDGSVRYRLDCSAGSYFIDPKSGSVPNIGDSIRIESSFIRMRYAQIPLAMHASFGNGRLRYFTTAGLDFNFLADYKSSTVLQTGNGERSGEIRSEGLQSTFVNGTVGGGVDFRIGKRVGVVVMPQYRFALKSINEGAPVKSFPKTFSIVSGLRISL